MVITSPHTLPSRPFSLLPPHPTPTYNFSVPTSPTTPPTSSYPPHTTPPNLLPPLHTTPPTSSHPPHLPTSSPHYTPFSLPPPTTHPHLLPHTTPTLREVIISGTVVTYNDRQQILCQKCTDFALDEVDSSQQQPGSVRGSKSMEREVRCVCVWKRGR